MHDPMTFESRLTMALGRLTADDPTDVDPTALARVIAAGARARRPGGRRLGLRGWRRSPRLATALAVALLVALLATAGALVGGRLLTSRSDPSPIPASRGAFTSVAPPGGGWYSATTLLDGRVLLIGGTAAPGTATIWDPTTGRSSETARLNMPRTAHSALLLGDGRVLVAGGSQGRPSDLELWDPTTGTFSAAGTLPELLHRPALTLLADGRRVLIAGGSHVEIWDPATMTASPSGQSDSTGVQTGILVRDGRVALIGWDIPVRIWDETASTLTTTDALPRTPAPRAGVRLRDGRVLLIRSIEGDVGITASVWDPTTGTSSPAGSTRSLPGGAQVLILLADGRVLLAGGTSQIDSYGLRTTSSAVVWDPGTLAFTPTSPMGQRSGWHSAALLADGRVLVVGTSDTEIYSRAP